MIALIWAVFRGSWMLQVATVALIGYGALKANNAYQQHKGGQAVIAKSKEVGKINNAKAAKSHAAARKPGSAERLLSSDCRDCR